MAADSSQFSASVKLQLPPTLPFRLARELELDGVHERVQGDGLLRPGDEHDLLADDLQPAEELGDDEREVEAGVLRIPLVATQRHEIVQEVAPDLLGWGVG